MIQTIITANGDIQLFTAEQSKLDKNAVEELKNLTSAGSTIDLLSQTPGFFDCNDSKIERIILTPDFHKGAGIPIGTVMLTKGFFIPQAMGNDINCGMRFYTTDLREEELDKKLPTLTKKLRYIFFEGGRQLPMTGRQRTAMFQYGLTGLLETCKDTEGTGIWSYYNRDEQEVGLLQTAFRGSCQTDSKEGLDDFIGNYSAVSYDEQTGSVGGGNHFAELQRVAELYDKQTANAWGIKKGDIVVMLHSGSLSIGHHSGLINRKTCESIYPAGIKHPENKIYFMPDSQQHQAEYNRVWSSINNAANFGFANRMFLGLMVQKALTETIRECKLNLIYDSPHNFIWKKDGQHYLHRKGACSAEGMEVMAGTPFEYFGEPVMIPGSMGSSSYLLCGKGNTDSLMSASHGAGRKLSRGEAAHGRENEFNEFMKKFHIVTPIDTDRNDIKGRTDILKKWEAALKEEAPYAYKDINEIVKVHEEHQIAGLVARMEPIMTVKG